MRVTTVITGLRQLAHSGSLGKGCTLLTNLGAPYEATSQLLADTRRLGRFNTDMNHFAGADPVGQRALLRVIEGRKDDEAGMRDLNAAGIKSAFRDIDRKIAKALYQLVGAVETASPKMIQVSGGRFVTGLRGGKPTLETVTGDFQLAARPVTYINFRPLAKALGIVAPRELSPLVKNDDPAMNVQPEDMTEWLRILNALSGEHYRLPLKQELERGICRAREIVSLNQFMEREGLSAKDLVDNFWMKHFANGFRTSAAAPLVLGGDLIQDGAEIQALLEASTPLSALDFARGQRPSFADESVWEVVGRSGTGEPSDEFFHVGFSDFSRRFVLGSQAPILNKGKNTIFRLATDA